jgi:hypothetical protein
MHAAVEGDRAADWADQHGSHVTSAGDVEESAIDGPPRSARAPDRFLLVKTGPIGSDLNDIGVALKCAGRSQQE